MLYHIIPFPIDNIADGMTPGRPTMATRSASLRRSAVRDRPREAALLRAPLPTPSRRRLRLPDDDARGGSGPCADSDARRAAALCQPRSRRSPPRPEAPPPEASMRVRNLKRGEWSPPARSLAATFSARALALGLVRLLSAEAAPGARGGLRSRQRISSISSAAAALHLRPRLLRSWCHARGVARHASLWCVGATTPPPSPHADARCCLRAG
jgi:hypothetical protein